MVANGQFADIASRQKRLRRFRVARLFGVFNHDVPLNLEERVTIIQGPNGFGKTVMLRLLAAVFSRGLGTLRSTPFERLEFDFDDDSRLAVFKQEQASQTARRPVGPDIVFEHTTGGRKEQATIEARSLRRPPMSPSLIEHEIPELERVGARAWQYVPTGEILSLDEVVERFPHVWGAPPTPDAERKSAWLVELRRAIPIHFVEAQRLLVQARETDPAYERGGALQQAVAVYASELASTIQAKLGDYANLSQSLDRSFPSRVVTAHPSRDLTSEALKVRLAALEHRRGELRDAGLLDTEEETEFPLMQDVDEEKRGLLDVYVRDSDQKLAVFDELAGKTELMKKILNSRFLYKSVDINREDGIRVVTEEGRQLPLTALSSGEQHELVLLYELLFRVSEGTLVLLDEPELSLHVEWQSAFLDDLLQIVRLRYLDAVIATHSPQIIGDRSDLTVALVGPR